MNVQRKLMLAQLSHQPPGWRDRGAHTCIDVDECLVGSHSCPSNSRCSNTPGSYRCICLAGWRTKDTALVLILTSVLLDHHHHNRLLPLPLQIWFHSTLLEITLSRYQRMYNRKPFVFLLRQRLLCEYHWL